MNTSTQFKIAIVEDDEQDMVNHIKAFEEYNCMCTKFYDKDSALAGLLVNEFDGLVLDINLPPDQDGGLDILIMLIKEKIRLPIIVVSSKDPSFYRNITKKLGAWEYLSKDWGTSYDIVNSMLLLINSIKDDECSPEQENEFEFCQNEFGEPIIKYQNEDIKLAAAPRRILHTLIKNTGKPVSHDILKNLLPASKTKDNLKNHIKNLKNDLRETDEKLAKRLMNVPGLGYIWIL